MRGLFIDKGRPVPEKVRVSCGFPGGRGNKRTTIGQCWQPAASADNHHEIFISPRIADGGEVLAILAHELCHAALPPGTGHKKPFATLAYSLGLEGKPTATVAGPAFKQYSDGLMASLGAYPHGALSDAGSGIKKQTTRMIKCTCAECGYTVRTTAKWLAVGVPHCPEHGEMVADSGEGDGE